MSAIDSPEMLAAYEAVRSDKDDSIWLLISDAGPTSDQLVLSETGTGGLAELTQKFDDSQVQYAYVRAEYANDAESKRIKFYMVVWRGSGIKPKRKFRMNQERDAVLRALHQPAIKIEAEDKRDLDEDDIIKILRKAGGVDYNGGRG